MSQVTRYVSKASLTFLFKDDSWWFPGTPLLFQLLFACLRLSSVFEESSWQCVHTVMMLTLFWRIVENVLLCSSFWNADRLAAGKEKIIFCLMCLFLNPAVSWFNTWQEYFFLKRRGKSSRQLVSELTFEEYFVLMGFYAGKNSAPLVTGKWHFFA